MNIKHSCKLLGVIFDVDGTLADTEDAHRKAFNSAFKSIGLSWHWSWPVYKDLLAFSGGRERIKAYAKSQSENITDEEAQALALNLHNIKNINYRKSLLKGDIKLRIGVKRLLDELASKKIKIAIATSSSKKNIETLLSLNLGKDWQKIFSVIETGDTVKLKKPHPDVYLSVIDKLKIPTSNLIAVEDTPNGLQAATAAGLSTLITTHKMTNGFLFKEAKLVVNSLGDDKHNCEVISGNIKNLRYVNADLLSQIIKTY